MRHLQDLHVLILGLGASGLAMARWCARHGAVVTVADTREAPPQLAALQGDLSAVRFIAGPFDAALVHGTEIRAVYRSPGLSPESIAPVVDAARAIGLPVGGELDLFGMALADLAQPPVSEIQADEAWTEPDESTKPVPQPDADDPELEQADGQPLPEGEADGDAPVDDDNAPLPEPPAPKQPTGYHPVVLGITGTNGKTTVTSLTGQLIARAGKTVAVAGNIGPTLLDTLAAAIDAAGDDLAALPQVWVLELSSFQLDAANTFEPTAGTVLNISQDHLDWHGSMAAYTAAKARVFGARGLMLLNREDPAVMAMLPAPIKVKLQKPQVRAHVTFGGDMPTRPGDFGLEVVNGMTWLVRAMEADETKRKRSEAADDLHIQRLMPADALRIRGRHNAVNALAGLALAVAAGCALAPVLYGLREYTGEPHRVEPVATVQDVEYFDDSKGTNVGATVAALNGLGAERRVVLILGGEGKGQDFAPLAAPVLRYARAVVLIGRDAPLIRAALEAAGVPLHEAGSMAEAVTLASESAQAGDAVLMSPACASFDMFKDYAHRAQVFVDAVHALADDLAMFDAAMEKTR
ncbi:UDP-N-acetylmuramoyl-L-alanine--D-glutamate ligase [Rhodoferax koreense]|uniref:UDP-N-acetylmuramoylalanine--D-glutamate ligase n=1 Tax=Rhodoferax koreensis TaxID=1842727 RepID=A0A1P8K1L8_9BURK|nr:UDP-N-acetylmuramoyl-L-alanine--D-glutamate ligase [Rhodoferax koreense]APW39900.1 UDP-N-acetylmuramoyl-L-alanine--D-glutamate ligase [Rhodoferax koreense]